jgi:hypothetical protein
MGKPADCEPRMEPPMKCRKLAAWICVVALLGMGATLLRAQPPQLPADGQGRVDVVQMRSEIIKLRTEVEMLQFDFDLARVDLLEDVKTRKSLKMAGAFMQFGGALQSAINEASKPDDQRRPKKSEQERKKEAEEAKKEMEEEKKEEAEQAAFLADRKKELARLAESLASKRLDLEDVERQYRARVR